MSYVVQADTGKIIWLDAHYKHFGFAFYCPNCGSHETYYTTSLVNYDVDGNKGQGGWLCMDCGEPFMPEEEG